MRGTAVGSRLVGPVVFFGVFFLVNIIALKPVSAQANAGTTVGAIICVASSSITLSSPANDSVVTDSQVALSGTVNQANQVDVYIDDVLDHVIPLTIGQTTYSGSVQLTAGTHTIKVVAINSCSGSDGSASAVVTYQPPPQTGPSNGSGTPTQVGGVIVGPKHEENNQSDEKLPDQTTPGLLPEALTTPIQGLFQWLNITRVGDNTEIRGLSLGRAAIIASGLYLLVVGMAAIVIQATVSLPFIAAIIPATSPAVRMRWVSGMFRAIGLLLVLGALLL